MDLSSIFKFFKSDPDDKLVALDPEPVRKKAYMYMGDGTVEEVFVDTSDIVNFDTTRLAPRGKNVTRTNKSSNPSGYTPASTGSDAYSWSGGDSSSSSSCDSGSSSSCD